MRLVVSLARYSKTPPPRGASWVSCWSSAEGESVDLENSEEGVKRNMGH